jgi:hypothetical protein
MAIKSITEAFAHVPQSFEVISHKEYNEMVKHKNPNAETAIMKILEKPMAISSDKMCDFLVGYNFEGKQLFKYLANSVNITYK